MALPDPTGFTITDARDYITTRHKVDLHDWLPGSHIVERRADWVELNFQTKAASGAIEIARLLLAANREIAAIAQTMASQATHAAREGRLCAGATLSRTVGPTIGLTHTAYLAGYVAQAGALERALKLALRPFLTGVEAVD